MKNKRILVTGGAGFIGSNICYELYENNEVVVIDDLSTGNYDNIRQLVKNNKIEFISRSITNFQFIKECFENVDYVLHQAAIPSVPRSIKDPITSNEANINGTLNVLMAAKENNVKKVVFASSSSIYGDTDKLPVVEKGVPAPLSPYAVSKLCGEYYCNVFESVYGLETISLRYFNVYGPMQDPYSQYAAVIPIFFDRVMNGKPPIIYGDGKQTRDFVFIKDVVQANIKALSSKAIGTYNISNGIGTSISDLAQIIIDLNDIELQPTFEKEREGDIKHSYADISLAKKNLNFKPKYSLVEGLKITKKWFDKKDI